jgi:hypothetical protein
MQYVIAIAPSSVHSLTTALDRHVAPLKAYQPDTLAEHPHRLRNASLLENGRNLRTVKCLDAATAMTRFGCQDLFTFPLCGIAVQAVFA